MKEVLAKLEAICTELELRTAQAEQNRKLYSDKDKALDAVKEKLDARENMLSARERIVKKAEDEDIMKEDLNTLKLEVQIHSQDLDKKEKELKAKLEKFDKEKKAHDEMVEMYAIKSARIGKIEQEMVDLKKNMRAVILKEIGEKLA